MKIDREQAFMNSPVQYFVPILFGRKIMRGFLPLHSVTGHTPGPDTSWLIFLHKQTNEWASALLCDLGKSTRACPSWQWGKSNPLRQISSQSFNKRTFDGLDSSKGSRYWKRKFVGGSLAGSASVRVDLLRHYRGSTVAPSTNDARSNAIRHAGSLWHGNAGLHVGFGSAR